MKKNLCWRVAFLGLFFAPKLFGTPCVVGDTLANYILLGATGCTVGTGANTVIVNDFTFSVAAMSAGLTTMTAAQISVTPSNVGTEWKVFFSATGNTPATGFTVSGSQFVKYDLGFNWDPVVIGAEDELDANTPTFPGTATVTTDLCNGQAFGGVMCPTPGSPTNTVQVFSDGHLGDAVPFNSTVLTPIDVNPGKIGTFSVVDLEANGAQSTITGFSTDIFAPEPGTWLLMAAGFVALGFLRRKPAF